MSILSGVFQTAELISALGRAGLDPSHHPFKRSLRRPGGPAGRRDKATHQWECNWKKPYVQQCVKVTEDGRTVKKTVKVKRSYKKRYNKQYRGGKFPHGKIFSSKKKHPSAKYKPAKSKGWAKASKKRGKKK